MAKVQIKSEKLTPFCFFRLWSYLMLFFSSNYRFHNSTLGLRCTMSGYQNSEILRFHVCLNWIENC